MVLFLVNGVLSIARLFEWDDRIVSVSLVAIGTSLPELATSLVTAFRKKSNLANWKFNRFKYF